MTNQEIADYLIRLDSDTTAFKESLMQLCWFMRGGVTYDQFEPIKSDTVNLRVL